MLVEKRAAEAAAGRIRCHIEWEPSNADSFVTKPGPFVDLVSGAIKDVTAKEPRLSTTGGTSDARFIKNYCPVLEFGLVGQTMHQVDERTAVADLMTLTAVYRKVLDRYFA
jgi:succinyl-diaminopimelate desuccinylase